MIRSRSLLRRFGPAALLLVLATSAPAADGTTLQRLRAERRAHSRALQALPAKAVTPATFALLVIPVDFSDRRLPGDWAPARTLAPRLTPSDGETLHRYFSVASGGRLDLRITLAPLVHLVGERRDYADPSSSQTAGTRALATQTLTAVRDLGLNFRSLDDDGPDGMPGTADDDGQVDGILILHSGPGLESEQGDGLIPPLQFYLEEPVVSAGIAASFYAVAGLGSGLGIWAHETGHLLGLAERYDPGLPVLDASEVHSRGGLGRFSLMAAGAWGTGGGDGAALPDGHSLLALGWVRPRIVAADAPLPHELAPTVTGGEVALVWRDGRPGSEYFLLETRDPVAAAPFDAAVPAGQLLIYHVDDSVPDGGVSADGHLRVRLVEADADGALAAGLDEGGLADLFPGALGQTRLGPATVPDSDGYGGPSDVVLRDIGAGAAGISFVAETAATLVADYRLGFSGSDPVRCDLAADVPRSDLSALDATVIAVGLEPWGGFADTGDTLRAALTRQADGSWRLAAPAVWLPAASVPAGAFTRFSVRFSGGGQDSPVTLREWVWSTTPGVLDFAAHWPEGWEVRHPDGDLGTTWHRWDGPPWLTADQRPVLACTGEQYPTAATWPEVAYDVRAHTTLTSGALGPEVAGVRLVHALQSEPREEGVVMDGASVLWVGPDGRQRPAEPVDGWPVRVSAQSTSALHGAGSFLGEAGELESGRPVWSVDLFGVPADAPGPWRLRLSFAGNGSRWDYRGWQIARLEPLSGPVAASAWPVRWTEAGLEVTSPPGLTGNGPARVRARAGAWSAWQDVLLLDEASLTAGALVPAATLLALLPGPPDQRQEVQVLRDTELGTVASRPVVLYPEAGTPATAWLGPAGPNPSAAGVRFTLTVPAGATGRLRVYDLRGRTVHAADYPAGDYLIHWDGCDRQGRRLAAGAYFIQVREPAGVRTRKVVLLH